ncbi:hypothetical protein EVAR_8473_1 [Eumeta japonica]|uniref:Uncharacterized protein n=1 Tax=Eumeta variegata TaxID=151549 RepID=A0A4C2A7N8_EUMVA|nr:hypothetical protein EVAR_8473_1 [Eumeta japonica]
MLKADDTASPPLLCRAPSPPRVSVPAAGPWTLGRTFRGTPVVVFREGRPRWGALCCDTAHSIQPTTSQTNEQPSSVDGAASHTSIAWRHRADPRLSINHTKANSALGEGGTATAPRVRRDRPPPCSICRGRWPAGG